MALSLSVSHSFFSSVAPKLKPEEIKNMSCFPFLRNKNEIKVNVLKCSVHMLCISVRGVRNVLKFLK